MGVTGRGEYIPMAIMGAATDHARRRGYTVATDELFLLALSELPVGTPARDVLEAAGVTSRHIADEIDTHPYEMPEGRGILFPPAFNGMAGRAEAFAATLGSGSITPEHVLLALMWDPTSLASQLLWRLGVRREDIVDAIRARGMETPRAPIPPQTEIQMGERVWIERQDLQRVISGLHLPPEVYIGFNYEGDRAWVIAEASVDLRSLIDDILAA